MDCQIWNSVTTIACLHQWQGFWAGVLAFTAGLLGFFAAIVAVVVTLRSERRRVFREIDALKKGLGAETRYFAEEAYQGALGLIRRMERNEQIKITEIENAAQFSPATVYNANSALVGLLGDRTPQIVLFYNKLEAVKSTRDRLSRGIAEIVNSRVTYSMREQAPQIIEPLIVACETVVTFLPSLKTYTLLDDKDSVFRDNIEALRKEWEIMRPTGS
jgi:hypothetical protein